MASKKVAGLDTKSDLHAELKEAMVEREGHTHEVLAHGTVRETNTVYEDRTVHPELDANVEYEMTEVDLGKGTILTNIGNPKGAK